MAEQAKDTFKIDNKKLLIGGSILLTLGLITGVVIYTNKKKKKKQLAARGLSGKSSSGGSSGFCKYGDSYPLKVGSCGANVTKLQKKLVSLGIFIGDYGKNGDGVDGKFGNDTAKGVKKAIGRSTFAQADMDNLNSIVSIS